MKKMKKIVDILHSFFIENNFKVYEDWEDGTASVYTNGTVIMRVINPHEGTDGKYWVDFDLWETFDRWSNCLDGFSTKDADEVLAKTTDTYSYVLAHKDEVIANGGYYNEEEE